MENNPNDRRIDYIEFPATDIPTVKAFYVSVFGWKFTDYGPEYTSFEDGRLAGGFWKNGKPSAPLPLPDGRGSVTEPRPSGSGGAGGPLVVIYAADLVSAEARVRSAGGKIVKPAFDFPGGRRFHFADPSGNELAIWSEK
jgi:predicted enzyme related to lactoylglutathione lyase